MPRISSAEASEIIASEQRQLNAAILPPTLARVRKLMQEETFCICNVSPWEFRLERAALHVFVPACDANNPDGYAASAPMPCIARESKLVGGGGESPLEYSYIEDDGRMVALDLIGEGHGLPKHNSLIQYGVFVPEGPKPTKEEIKAARAQLASYYDRLIAEARDAYDKGPTERAAVIGERHLLAARVRGIDERWVHHSHAEEAVRCVNCGSFNAAEIAQCKCGHVLNEELYIENQTRKARLDLQIQSSIARESANGKK